MKVLIVSDTHRRDNNLLKVLDMVKPVDLLVHCGDTEGSEGLIADMADCPSHIVAGNNDFWSTSPREKEFEIGKYKVWLTHGHNYYVSMNYEMIKNEARSRYMDIVMCGHTHKPVIDISSDLTVINPGSLSYPRQEGRKPSYVIMETDEKGNADYKIYYL